MNTRILGVGGSMRPNSGTSTALRAAMHDISRMNVETTILDVSDLQLPMFNGTNSLDGYPEHGRQAISFFLEAVDRSHGIIFASPTYHNTISGSLKNALDFLELLDGGLKNKAVALMTLQGGTSGTGNNTLTTMLFASRALGAWVIPTMVCIQGGTGAFDTYGRALDPQIASRIHSMGLELVQTTTMLNDHSSTLITLDDSPSLYMEH